MPVCPCASSVCSSVPLHPCSSMCLFCLSFCPSTHPFCLPICPFICPHPCLSIPAHLLPLSLSLHECSLSVLCIPSVHPCALPLLSLCLPRTLPSLLSPCLYYPHFPPHPLCSKHPGLCHFSDTLGLVTPQGLCTALAVPSTWNPLPSEATWLLPHFLQAFAQTAAPSQRAPPWPSPGLPWLYISP